MLGHSSAADAADIRVLCSNGLKAVMEELAPQFERATGHKVVMKFGLAAGFKQQIQAGETFDLAVLTPPLIDDLVKQGRMAADSRADIARTGLGLMIRAGARKPDVTTTETFKRALLNAKSIAFAKEGASGIAFASLIERLSIADTLKTRLKPTSTGEEVNDLVVRGNADFGILPLSERLAVRGAELGGMFPADVQSYITMTAAVSSGAKQGAAARDLIKFLTSPAVLPTIKAKDGAELAGYCAVLSLKSNSRPSAKITFVPGSPDPIYATGAPFLAGHRMMVTSSPGLTDRLVQPALVRIPGLFVSMAQFTMLPLLSFTSR
jgi:molybdate transport system substrate-binding protein